LYTTMNESNGAATEVGNCANVSAPAKTTTAAAARANLSIRKPFTGLCVQAEAGHGAGSPTKLFPAVVNSSDATA